MTREETRDEIINIRNKDILCELPTSFGKTKVALDLINARFSTSHPKNILIVIPRLVLIDNWKDEFVKWGYEKYLPIVEFVTYKSFPKKAGEWDVIIFDEAHHMSERCRDAYVHGFTSKNNVLLSATVNRNIKWALQEIFPNLYIYKVSTKQAIQEAILPDPKVYLIPLKLNKTDVSCEIIKNKSVQTEVVIPFHKRFQYAKVKNRRVVIRCTQQQYYDDMSALISWYKKKSHMTTFKNLFLRKSGERLKWLSEQKTEYVKFLLSYLDKQRTLTFCNGVSQTEELGKYCVNYSNKDSQDNLQRFNKEQIDHITACNMLDEGVNLVNCRVGVYAVLNSSERMVKQKLGRLLRHSDPIIVIPYFEGTRDEEIVQQMLEDYNPELVHTVKSLTELKL